MQQNNQSNTFSYTYSAKEQAEIQRIREKYAPTPSVEDKMTRLRRLDASVTNTAQAVSLVFGVIGMLILGTGMSLCMSELPSLLHLSTEIALPLGIGIGAVGGILAALAYPAYSFIVQKMRKRLAPEILRLSEELMK